MGGLAGLTCGPHRQLPEGSWRQGPNSHPEHTQFPRQRIDPDKSSHMADPTPCDVCPRPLEPVYGRGSPGLQVLAEAMAWLPGSCLRAARRLRRAWKLQASRVWDRGPKYATVTLCIEATWGFIKNHASRASPVMQMQWGPL